MMIVREMRERAELTQTELAELGGTSQPTIAAYESGSKVPSLRTLRRLANAAGFELDLSITSTMTREERRSLHLHRVIARHLEEAPEAVVGRARSNLRLMKQLHPGAADLLDEWEYILNGPTELIAETITSTSLRGRELRQVTPFAGVLTPSERASAYRDFRRTEAAS